MKTNKVAKTSLKARQPQERDATRLKTVTIGPGKRVPCHLSLVLEGCRSFQQHDHKNDYKKDLKQVFVFIIS